MAPKTNLPFGSGDRHLLSPRCKYVIPKTLVRLACLAESASQSPKPQILPSPPPKVHRSRAKSCRFAISGSWPPRWEELVGNHPNDWMASWTEVIGSMVIGSICPNGIIFHQPKFSWNKGISWDFPSLGSLWGPRSCEVVIIWPDQWVSYNLLINEVLIGVNEPSDPNLLLTNGESWKLMKNKILGFTTFHGLFEIMPLSPIP